jgi:preprotein translocase subunit YajC
LRAGEYIALYIVGFWGVNRFVKADFIKVKLNDEGITVKLSKEHVYKKQEAAGE